MNIAIIGAGSQFTLHLLRSIYQSAAHDNYHIRFMDIRDEALIALQKLTDDFNKAAHRSFTFSYYKDRKEAIKGADHVLISYAVDFPDSYLRSCWVLKNHGIPYGEAETATPGALMAALRHLPPLLQMTEEVQQLTDGAWLHIINNPLPRLLRGVIKGTGYDRVVGHCHGTWNTLNQFAQYTDTPWQDIDLFVAGINHFHILQKAVNRRNGKNLLESLKNLPSDIQKSWQTHHFTQFKVYEEIGYFIGCGEWHTFDYVPYSNHRMYRHSHYNTWDRQNIRVMGHREAGAMIGCDLKDKKSIKKFLNERETEQMFHTMQALSGESDSYHFLSGNMPNKGLIPNLPDHCIVELPATVTSKGIEMHPIVEPLPLFFENWLQIQTTIAELSVNAVIENSRQAAIEAIVCDPSFRDCDCSPGQLLDEMLEANKGLVPLLK